MNFAEIRAEVEGRAYQALLKLWSMGDTDLISLSSMDATGEAAIDHSTCTSISPVGQDVIPYFAEGVPVTDFCYWVNQLYLASKRCDLAMIEDVEWRIKRVEDWYDEVLGRLAI